MSCHRDATPTGRFLQRSPSLADKTIRAVEVVTHEQFTLDRNSAPFRTLRELISLRNRLVHVDEEPVPVQDVKREFVRETEDGG